MRGKTVQLLTNAYGATGAIKWSVSERHSDIRRHACYEPNWRQYSFVSLIHRTLFHSGFLNNTKQRTSTVTWNTSIYKVMRGCLSCIMTVALVWRAPYADVFRPKMNVLQKWTIHHIRYVLSCANFVCSQNWRTASKGIGFFRHLRRSETRATILQSVPEGRLRK